MSVTGVSKPGKNYKKSFHGRNDDSGELDVFEATKYFSSAATDGAPGKNGATFEQKIGREERQENPIMEKKKKYKQPSSPGGRLASFLNFLIHQTSSKKKKSMSTTAQSTMKDEDESPGRRRSSVSHFLSASTADSKSINSSSSFGFRTPPPYLHTPTETHKDMRSYSDHKPMVTLSKVCYDDKRRRDCARLDEKFKFSAGGFSEKLKNSSDNGRRLSEKDRVWANNYSSSEEKKFRRVKEDLDDGAGSDSSSDLFELENCDFGYYYSSGLPVYETTHVDSIKRGASNPKAVIS